jgi:hypothetical protein
MLERHNISIDTGNKLETEPTEPIKKSVHFSNSNKSRSSTPSRSHIGTPVSESPEPIVITSEQRAAVQSYVENELRRSPAPPVREQDTIRNERNKRREENEKKKKKKLEENKKKIIQERDAKSILKRQQSLFGTVLPIDDPVPIVVPPLLEIDEHERYLKSQGELAFLKEQLKKLKKEIKDLKLTNNRLETHLENYEQQELQHRNVKYIVDMDSEQVIKRYVEIFTICIGTNELIYFVCCYFCISLVFCCN